MTETTTPRTAGVVIVGGGILGLSTAWHLTCAGACDVLVLERGALAAQATSQAAALLTRGRNLAPVSALVRRTFEAIDALGEELGEPLPLHRNGTLYVAASAASRAALSTLMAVSRGAGIVFSDVDADDARRLAPWLAVTDDVAAHFCAGDGFIDPYLLADAFGRAARRRGARLRTGVAVEKIVVADGRVRGVVTACGTVAAPRVIVAAGAWGNLLTASLGCALPMAPVRSQYWITETDPVFPPSHPAVLLPDARAYTRPELGALLFGVREAESVGVDPRSLPADTCGYAFADDPEGLASLEQAGSGLQRFLPALARIGIRRHVAGFSTYTPDGVPAFGAAPGIEGLLVVGGCCGVGIAASGGIGSVLADLTLGLDAALDPAPFSCARFGAIDPFTQEFTRRCARARSAKREG